MASAIFKHEKASRAERLFRYNLFIQSILFWCREGGEPPRTEVRQILSPILVLLQRVAWHRTRQHNSIHCNI